MGRPGRVSRPRPIAPRVGRVLALILATTLPAVLAACAPSGGAGSTPRDPDRLPARLAVADAVRALSTAPGGHLWVRLVVAGATYDDDGTWTTSPAAQHVTRRGTTSTGRHYVIDAIGADGHFYARAEAETDGGGSLGTGGCWLRGKFGDVADASGVAFGTAGDSGDAGETGDSGGSDAMVPTALLVAATVRGASYVGAAGHVNGTVSLRAAVGLADPRLAARLHLRDGRVGAALDLTDGRLTGLSVSPRSFSIALGPTGGRTDPLAGASLRVRFSVDGAPDPILPPPPGQVTELHRGPGAIGPRQGC